MTTWDLLHHFVFKKNKPEKFRMAFDTTVENKSTSVKHSLLTGADLLNSLIGVLLQFCNHKIAFSGNSEAIYQQKGVSCDDADPVRFLWLTDSDPDGGPDTYTYCITLSLSS